MSVRPRGDFAAIRVQDEGMGVDQTLAPRLFEPFVTGRADGTGLGLAIVREIARAHNGEARYKASQKGAVFEIELPCLRS
jgi:signal transduction histidine kinase